MGWQAGKTKHLPGGARGARRYAAKRAAAHGKAYRAISTARLHVSVVHLRPIDVLVSDGPHAEASSRGGLRA